MLTLFFINSLPLYVAVGVWLRSCSELGQLSLWRRAFFLAGAAANTVSASVLLAFFLHAQMVMHTPGSKPVDLDRIYPVFTVMGIALLATILAFAGSRVSRWVLAVGGVLTVCLWYLAALAASR